MILRDDHRHLTRQSFLFEAITFAFDVDDRGTVQQSVQRGGGHHGVIGKDLSPVAEGFVAGKCNALFALIPLTDDLEQQAGLEGIEGEITHLVNH